MRRSLVLLWAGLLVLSCDVKRGTAEKSVVLEIGENRYHADAFRQYVKRRLSDLDELVRDQALRDQYLRDFADEQLLLIEAGRSNIRVAESEVLEALKTFEGPAGSAGDVADFRRGVEQVLTVQKFIRERVRPRTHVSFEEARDYFAQHHSEFVGEETIRVSEILVDTEKQARKLWGALNSDPAQFPALARAHSAGASGAQGGDLGSFRRGELPAQFEKALFKLRPGQISSVIRSSFGFHLFRVEGKTPARRSGFEQVQEEVLQRLLVEKEREALRQELERIRSSVAVRFYPENVVVGSDGALVVGSLKGSRA